MATFSSFFFFFFRLTADLVELRHTQAVRHHFTFLTSRRSSCISESSNVFFFFFFFSPYQSFTTAFQDVATAVHR